MAAIAALLAANTITTDSARARGFLRRLAGRAMQKVEQKAEQEADELVGGHRPADLGSQWRFGPGRRVGPAMMPKAVRGGAPREAAPGARSLAAEPGNATAAASVEAVKFPSRMSPPTGFEATQVAYDTFGKVRCPSCEGGYGYDGWPSYPRDELSGKYNETGKRLGAMAVGEVHRWKGAEASGTLTVVAEETVGGFRCRRLRYRLVKGTASAERPGLVCWGYANAYAASEGWNEVY